MRRIRDIQQNWKLAHFPGKISHINKKKVSTSFKKIPESTSNKSVPYNWTYYVFKMSIAAYEKCRTQKLLPEITITEKNPFCIFL